MHHPGRDTRAEKWGVRMRRRKPAIWKLITGRPIRMKDHFRALAAIPRLSCDHNSKNTRKPAGVRRPELLGSRTAQKSFDMDIGECGDIFHAGYYNTEGL